MICVYVGVFVCVLLCCNLMMGKYVGYVLVCVNDGGILL